MTSVKSTAQWTITPERGLDGLQLNQDCSVPELCPTACLVRMHAVSLNYRDVACAIGTYPLANRKTFVPCSDGAGEVVAVGSQVSLIKTGDKVCPNFMQQHLDGIITPEIRQSTLGTTSHGVLQQYKMFDQTGLVKFPEHLSYMEASTLPCAAVTAWNALFGIKDGRQLQRGSILLTQGTGGPHQYMTYTCLLRTTNRNFCVGARR